MYNAYLSTFIIILGFATVSNLWRIFIRTIPFSHQENYLETNWILTMCEVIELLHCRVCTTRDDSCWSCVKIGLCNWVVFARETFQFEKKIQITVALKLTNGYIITLQILTVTDSSAPHLKARPRKYRKQSHLLETEFGNSSVCWYRLWHHIPP